jgi:hypothetical protein
MPETGNDISSESTETRPVPQKDVVFCPSAQPGLSRSVLIGVVDKSRCGDFVSYLPEPVAVTDGTIVAFTGGPVQATQLFRFAAPCEKSGCHNWSGSTCGVAKRIVQILPAVVSELPDCVLRPSCRWFRQEGQPACLRCPQVVTDDADFEAALAHGVITAPEYPQPLCQDPARNPAS